MSEQQKRIFFLCTYRSIRELMAASLLAAQAPKEWDIWIAPETFTTQDHALVRQVFDEVHIPLLTSQQTAEPSFDTSWDEGVVLCSGATNQWPLIPNAGRRQLWSVEDIPSADLSEAERLHGYRSIRVTLMQAIRMNLLLTKRLAMVSPRK